MDAYSESPGVLCRDQKLKPNWATNTSAFFKLPVPPGRMIDWKSGWMNNASLRKSKRSNTVLVGDIVESCGAEEVQRASLRVVTAERQ